MPVYPRWRGEHFQMSNEFISYDGLSPLARGTPVRLVRFIGEVRFIPAGAGNTAESPSPRFARAGLSPLARGTPLKIYYCFIIAF